MSYRARRELLLQVAARYREADHLQKSVILDEFVASTGYARKYAIHLLAQSPPLPTITPPAIRKPRPRAYGAAVQEALFLAWSAANGICSKRLVPFLPELIPILERHGHLVLSEETRTQLFAVSPATVDRLLQPLRLRDAPHGITTTQAGRLLKHQVPVRTFADWSEERPGFMEADLVAHCGVRAEGAFLQTLVLTNIATGWTECLPLLFRSQETVVQALAQARQLLPFPLLGLDTDNGSEFLNAHLLEYCRTEAITFTRGRAYKKNDQCFVEQKNGAIVRQLVGYDRFEGQAAYQQLIELYRAVRLYVNFFQPSLKLLAKQRDGAKVTRRYAPAQTPFQRLLGAKVLLPTAQEHLAALYQALDPVRLLRQLEQLQEALWRHACVGGPLVPCTAALPEVPCRQAFDPAAARGTTAAQNGPPLHTPEAVVPSSEETTPRQKRQYRRTKPFRVPHTWRTREDPFADVWEEVEEWLAREPERTAKSLFQQLQARDPDRYPEGQLRTLQRRVKAWRAQAILAFNRDWLDAERSLGSVLPGPLRAVPFRPGAAPGEPPADLVEPPALAGATR